MKKIIAPLFFVLILVGIVSYFQSPSLTSPPQQNLTAQIKYVAEEIGPQEKKADPPKEEAQRVIAHQIDYSKKPSHPQLKIDVTEIEFQYSFDEHTHIAKNIVAIAKSTFKPSMGQAIYENPNFQFVQSSDSSIGQLSLFDSKTKQLRPLSHTIKISNVNEERRQQIASLGLKESLYFENLGLLFIEANSTDYSTIFEELRTEGFGPEYQVLNRFYVPK